MNAGTIGRYDKPSRCPTSIRDGNPAQHRDIRSRASPGHTENRSACSSHATRPGLLALTGLPNRILLEDRLAQALLGPERHGEPFLLMLMLMDLDGFKAISDRFGHHTGDAILVEVAQRLRQVLREIDTVARLGGDEFVVLPPTANHTSITSLCTSMLKALGEPLQAEPNLPKIRASIGVVPAGSGEQSGKELLVRADQAMYTAKRRGSGFAVWEEEKGEGTKPGSETPARSSIQQSQG